MLLAPIIGTGLLGQLLKLGFHSLRERRWRPGRLAEPAAEQSVVNGR